MLIQSSSEWNNRECSVLKSPIYYRSEYLVRSEISHELIAYRVT